MLFVDLDRFKYVNDSLGHDAGDAILTAVAARLRATVRSREHVARLGGDEFVVVGHVADEDEAFTLARRILAELATPIRAAGVEVTITPSIGVVTDDAGRATPAELLRAADLAMYRAKADGRATVAVFDASLRTDVHRRVEAERRLRHAVTSEELVVFYQPQVRLADRQVIGFEALARLPGGPTGPIAPSEFIAVAEETGLVVPLGEAVLDRALRQWRAWRDRRPDGPPTVAVNVSPRQLHELGFVATVTTALARHGVDPAALTIEVTEAAVVQHRSAVAVLTRLRSLGVRVALDDFGTGYSGLSRLARLPIDHLKIDQSFVHDLGVGDPPLAESIIRAIVSRTRSV